MLKYIKESEQLLTKIGHTMITLMCILAKCVDRVWSVWVNVG